MLEQSFHRGFEEEFVNPDGALVALRSAISE